MKFIYNDGGRANAGYKGSTGDCVTRAVAITTSLPYQTIYDAMARGNAAQRITKRSRKSDGVRTAAHGVSVQRKWFKDYMAALAFVWHPTMGIGTGCKVHLTDGELPDGRLVVAVSKHYTCVIDGVIHDTHDPQRGGGNEYGYFDSPNGWGPGWVRHANDKCWVRQAPGRCVYGYWVQE